MRSPVKQGTQVGIGEDRVDAGDGARLRRVDRAQPRMRDRAAQHRHMQQAGQRDVVDEAGAPRSSGTSSMRGIERPNNRLPVGFVVPPAGSAHVV